MYRFTEKMEAKTRVYWPDETFTRKQMKEIYETEIDHEQYAWFENWMSDMRRSGNVILKMPSEEELSDYAKDCAKTITIRSYTESGNSNDETRESTPEEEAILYKIIYGALLAVRQNHGEMEGNSVDYKYDFTKSHACTDCSEYITHQFLPDCNAYMSVYSPVMAFYAY